MDTHLNYRYSFVTHHHCHPTSSYTDFFSIFFTYFITKMSLIPFSTDIFHLQIPPLWPLPSALSCSPFGLFLLNFVIFPLVFVNIFYCMIFSLWTQGELHYILCKMFIIVLKFDVKSLNLINLHISGLNILKKF